MAEEVARQCVAVLALPYHSDTSPGVRQASHALEQVLADGID